jgi:hypothetical protein
MVTSGGRLDSAEGRRTEMAGSAVTDRVVYPFEKWLVKRVDLDPR